MRKTPLARPQSHIRAISTGIDRPWARPYERTRDLPRLVPLMLQDLDVSKPDAHARLVSLLRKALWQERRRARNRHWSYDPARHAALVKAYDFEARELKGRAHASAASQNRAAAGEPLFLAARPQAHLFRQV